MNEEVIQRIREAFAVERERTTLLESKVKELEKVVAGHKLLLIDLRGDIAYRFHTEVDIKPHDIDESEHLTNVK